MQSSVPGGSDMSEDSLKELEDQWAKTLRKGTVREAGTDCADCHYLIEAHDTGQEICDFTSTPTVSGDLCPADVAFSKTKAKELLGSKYNDLTIREILEGCQYDKGFEACNNRMVKGTGLTQGQLVELAEEGKLVVLDEYQSWPNGDDANETDDYVDGWYRGQVAAKDAGFKRVRRIE